jgi:MraZ protein
VEYSQPTVFKGTYRHRIDAKGRLPVPAAFRRALAGEGVASLVVTLLDQCLAAYPPAEWSRLEEQLRALPAFSRPVKALTRLLASRAADCDFDVQGRILLPPPLRESAGLQQEVVVVGVLNRFEVWAPPAWDSFLRESERLLDDVALGVEWPLLPALPSEAPRPPVSGPPLPQRKPKR